MLSLCPGTDTGHLRLMQTQDCFPELLQGRPFSAPEDGLRHQHRLHRCGTVLRVSHRSGSHPHSGWSFIYYAYSVLPACQKKALDLIVNGCEPPCGC